MIDFHAAHAWHAFCKQNLACCGLLTVARDADDVSG